MRRVDDNTPLYVWGLERHLQKIIKSLYVLEIPAVFSDMCACFRVKKGGDGVYSRIIIKRGRIRILKKYLTARLEIP